jgi:hypothetical protein
MQQTGDPKMLDLDEPSTERILHYLNCPRTAPTHCDLDRLISAFVRAVPWESVFRIIKRNATSATSDCPRLPQEVWRDAITFGGGGTCFEINYAFFALLQALGYEGYMTINDMDEARSCHAAIVIVLQGQKYLVDVSVPLPSAVAFTPHAPAQLATPWLDFTICPMDENRYTVARAPHARPYIFTFIDTPVRAEDFEAAIEADYLPTGYFLNRVVINKVLGEAVWLFNSDTKPYRLESFDHTGKHEIPLNAETLAQSLAEQYHIPAAKIHAALSLVDDSGSPRWRSSDAC